jgi:hypothetical protein
MPVLLDSNGD